MPETRLWTACVQRAVWAPTKPPSPVDDRAVQFVMRRLKTRGDLPAFPKVVIDVNRMTGERSVATISQIANVVLRDNARDPSGAPVLGAVRYLLECGEEELAKDVLVEGLNSEDRGQRDAIYQLLAEAETDWADDLALAGLEKEFGEERSGAIDFSSAAPVTRDSAA